MTRLNRSHALTAIVATVAAGAVVGGVAIATQESPTIEACVNQAGIPRFVADADNCRRGETHVSWNKVGPQGLQGEPGVDGQDGKDGKDGLDGKDGQDGQDGQDGSPGISEVLARTSAKVDISPQSEATVEVFCELGESVIGGGFDTEGTDIRILSSRAIGTSSSSDIIITGNSWRVRAFNLRLVSGSRWVQVYATCAKVG
jgi:hypothetical protein